MKNGFVQKEKLENWLIILIDRKGRGKRRRRRRKKNRMKKMSTKAK